MTTYLKPYYLSESEYQRLRSAEDIEARTRPLIEAARAYRDVYAESQRRWDGIAYDAALMRLLEAARTFDAGQVEEEGGE